MTNDNLPQSNEEINPIDMLDKLEKLIISWEERLRSFSLKQQTNSDAMAWALDQLIILNKIKEQILEQKQKIESQTTQSQTPTLKRKF
jgi:hypothetical protein